jgi:hypothetical protein
VVGSQTVSLTPGHSFGHNLCCRCLNGSCKLILDIYTSIVFQWYKELLKARSFDLRNQTLNFRESQRTPKSPFRECESHPHTLLKVGLRQCHNMMMNMWLLKNYVPKHIVNFFSFYQQTLKKMYHVAKSDSSIKNNYARLKVPWYCHASDFEEVIRHITINWNLFRKSSNLRN